MDPVSSLRRPLTSSSLDLTSHGPPEELASKSPPPPASGASSEPPVVLERVTRNVLLCHRPVTFLPAPLAKTIASAGGDHQWLKVGAREVGMGRDDGSVPIDSPDYPGIPSRLVDHTGQSAAPSASCEIIPDVDPDCVERSLTLGQPTDRWLPGLNDCHTIAEDILRSCDRPKAPPTTAERQAGAGRP